MRRAPIPSTTATRTFNRLDVIIKAGGVAGLLEFSEPGLVENLERLAPELRVVFAAACAERLLPAYGAFSTKTGRGEPTELRTILSRLWDDLTGNRMTDDEVKAKIDACMKLIPREDEVQWVPEQGPGEDAVAAAAYAFRCRQNWLSQEAAWSARCAYEALDNYVSISENIDWSGPDPNATALALERILAHPVVQAELARQRRDLEELVIVGAGEMQHLVGRFRDRAKAESRIYFGGP